MSELLSRPETQSLTVRDRVRGFFKGNNLIKGEVLVEPVSVGEPHVDDNMEEKARRRLELFQENPTIAAEKFGRRIAQEYINFSAGQTDTFSAYFVICPDLHHESDAAEMHRLSHHYFADTFGYSTDDILSLDLTDGQEHVIASINDTELHVQFNRYDDAAAPSGVLYRGVKL